MHKNKGVDVGNIFIKGLYGEIQIIDMNVTLEKNQHAKAFICGMISDEDSYEYINRKMEGKKFFIISNGEFQEAIFAGLVKKICLIPKEGYKIINIYGISASILFDKTKKYRSFQNTSLGWQDIIMQILQDTHDAKAIFSEPNKSIDVPIIQYDETDWEFIVRICSMYHASVFADIIGGNPWIYCGLPPKTVKKHLEVSEETWLFDSSYYSMLNEKKNVNKQDYLVLQIRTYTLCGIGEGIINYNNKKIHSYKCFVNNGLLEYEYIIGSEAYAENSVIYNEKIRGASIKGTVLDTQSELVKIWLEIDNTQEKADAYWYKWMPESGNCFYCMPEIGTTVYLYVGSENEKDAIAIGCAHQNFETGREQLNPKKCSLDLQSLKKISVFPDLLAFSNEKEKRLSVNIDDSEKIDVGSCCKMSIRANDAIGLSGKSVSIQASGEIAVIRKDLCQPTVINMSNQFDAVGRYVEVNAMGSPMSMIPVGKNDEQAQYSLKGVEAAISASTPYGGKEMTEEIQVLALASKVNKMETSLPGEEIRKWEKQSKREE